MNDLTWLLLQRLAKVLLNYIEYSLGGLGKTPEQMLEDIRHIRKDYTL